MELHKLTLEEIEILPKVIKSFLRAIKKSKLNPKEVHGVWLALEQMMEKKK